jgi:hypothetical protein
VVGGAVWLRTDRQVAELQGTLAKSPAALRSVEVPRMERIQRNFRVIKTVEIVVLAVGFALAFLFPRGSTGYALGIGLAVEVAILLWLDLLASRRADVYLEALRRLT